MTNQEILANGPEGWTHVEVFEGENYAPQKPYYYRLKFAPWCNRPQYSAWDAGNEIWLEGLPRSGSMRSRSDIERIVYLESVLKGKAA